MNYELAKKLKDAGFEEISNNDVERIIVDGSWGAPTLSELIEACGGYFWNLYRAQNVGMAGLNRDHHHYGAETSPELGIGIQTGSTPEEAVANLYLALHNKKLIPNSIVY